MTDYPLTNSEFSGPDGGGFRRCSCSVKSAIRKRRGGEESPGENVG
jgi:hypothetical protein